MGSLCPESLESAGGHGEGAFVVVTAVYLLDDRVGSHKVSDAGGGQRKTAKIKR